MPSISQRALSDLQVAQYQLEGYVIARGLFDADEIAQLSRAARQDKALAGAAYERGDGEGGQAKLAVWNHPGDDIYGIFSRSARIVDSVEKLLGEEAYHWHSKMNMKEPRVGGAWAWHQDYGYWYHNACLWPKMVSVMVALDQATRANGCLQVLRGSHLLGRLDHSRKEGEQAGADPARVEIACKQLELVYCEMEPGDAIFFHGNTLHRSDRNNSDHPRWTLISCYNARSNSPYEATRHPAYTPLAKVGDEAIRQVGDKRFADTAGFISRSKGGAAIATP